MRELYLMEAHSYVQGIKSGHITVLISLYGLFFLYYICPWTDCYGSLLIFRPYPVLLLPSTSWPSCICGRKWKHIIRVRIWTDSLQPKQPRVSFTPRSKPKSGMTAKMFTTANSCHQLKVSSYSQQLRLLPSALDWGCKIRLNLLCCVHTFWISVDYRSVQCESPSGLDRPSGL
jgi:hypothetical protein